MPMTAMTAAKLTPVLVAMALSALWVDARYLHAADFKTYSIDRYEEKIEEYESKIAYLQSLPVLTPNQKVDLLKAKNRREKYLRKLERKK